MIASDAVSLSADAAAFRFSSNPACRVRANMQFDQAASTWGEERGKVAPDHWGTTPTDSTTKARKPALAKRPRRQSPSTTTVPYATGRSKTRANARWYKAAAQTSRASFDEC